MNEVAINELRALEATVRRLAMAEPVKKARYAALAEVADLCDARAQELEPAPLPAPVVLTPIEEEQAAECMGRG